MAISDTAIAAGLLSVLAVGLHLVDIGTMEIAALPPVLALTTMIFGPVMATSSVLHEFNQAVSSAARLFALVDQQPMVKDSVTEVPADIVIPSIHFDAVDFRYPAVSRYGNGHKHSSPPPVLQSLGFDVAPGSTVALVGPSGAGKSTVVNLLLRFWDVDQGNVRIGGVDVRDFPQEELRRRIAVVSQRAHIFNTTIRENLLLGNPGASDEELEQAAKQASLHKFIHSLPQGYDTVVGEMGSKLSGGQRQRMAIARAFLKKAPILVLDEPTSNLDAETEQAIQSVIQDLMKGCTTLVIAHRLSTVVHADEILVLDEGSVVERGTHQHLTAQGGVYARLFACQQAGIGVLP